MTRILRAIVFVFIISNLNGQIDLELKSWDYILGLENETLKDFNLPDFTSSKKVTLPHRISIPNRSMWYQKHVESLTKGYLYLNGDDGTQLWIDNRRILPLWGFYYPLVKEYSNSKIIIRVLNNAVAGGLRKVEWVSSNSFNTIDSLNKEADEQLNKFENRKSQTKQVKYPYSFTFWGDPQSGWDTFTQLIKCINLYKDPFTIGLGDFVSNGSDPKQTLILLQKLQLLKRSVSLVSIPGNHDYDGYFEELEPNYYLQYINRQSKTYKHFSHDKSKCSFIILDPNRNFPFSIDTEQQKYVDSVFATKQWKESDWRIVLVHQPPYGQGWYGYEGEMFLREWFDTYSEKQKIDIVFSGHIHDYERISKSFGKQNTVFIVSGGAGGTLEPKFSNPTPKMDTIIKKHHYGRVELLNKTKALIKIYDLNNNVIDRIEIIKKLK